jgi:fibronectin type 3 domain-containing protein/regulation of enolase protein 1 (concanavalin A-like superfamily)
MKTRAASLLAALVALTAQVHAFTHPCAPTTLQELDTIKANLDKEPWKSGYAALAADGRSQLGYQMGGPFEVVKRNPNENLWPWRSDMMAVYNLARMWYFTGNAAYAQKAHDILIAWATTQKVFGGQESGLDLGDYAVCYGSGASILRGTWPGWTQQDTITVQNYFRNVLWPATASPYNVSGPANKGSLNLVAGAVIAVFCDDTAMFNHVIDVFRNYPGSGLPNILPTGQMGETGRDMGHAFNDLLARTLTAEIAWKQGIDLYSEMDNRLLAAGEYHARNTSTLDTPFVPYGTVDYNYYQNSGALISQDLTTYYLLQNAYKNRLGLPTPWIDRKLREQGVHGGNFMFAKTVDFSTATPPAPDPRPAVSPASSGLTLTTLGTQTAGRSVSYANGVWTMTGLGGGVWTDGTDDCQLAYQAMTGDCAMVAQVTSVTYSGNQNGKMGLMIRDNLVGAISQRAWISITPTASSGNLIEARATGWTATWGGSNWARRSQGLPLPLPYWLKIERKGNVITSYTSQDGTSWSPTISSDFGNLPSTVYVGMFVCSGNTTPNTATFANLSFTGGTGGLVTTPAAPAAMLASGSGKAITLRWLPSFGATAYDVLRSTTSGGGYTVIASDLTAAKTSYVDTSAAAGTTYYYVVRAKNSAGTSSNSPEFGASLLPVPLVNLAVGGTATDSATTQNPANCANAFDQNFGTQWFYSGTTGWLKYDFGANSAQVVKSYTIVSAVDFPTRDPKDWLFEGSNDGSTWTTLDTQTSQTFAFRTTVSTFPLTNTTAYRYYRLNITANNGDASFVHIGGLGLWGDGGRSIPDGSYVLASRNSNKAMDVTGTANGAQVVQQTFAGGDSQQWTLAWQGNGVYRATHVASAKALDNGGTSTAGANLVIQPSSAANSQLWKLVPDSDGFYRIESANSSLAADVSGASTANGAGIVQSISSGGNSQQWTPGSAVASQPIPPAPTGLAGTATSISQINLSWTASPGAVGYRIKRATTSGGPYTPISVPVNTTSYSDTGLNASTTYYYVVSALNGSGESADSAQASVTTLTAPPDAPTGVTSILGTSGITLNWTASGGATSYTIQRATTSGGPYTTIATGLTGTSYTDTSISHDTTYYYVVVATNANGSSPTSSELTVGAGTLVAQLKFDETGGTIATDSSGRGQNATLFNGANFAVPGMFESGLNLPATANQYAALPSGIASGLTDFTIATWIKVNAFATWQRIFDFGTGTGTNMFLAAQGAAGAGRPRFSIRTSSVAEQFIDSSVAITAGVWTHVAVTRSGNTVRLYINGSLAGTGTITLSPSDLGFTTQNYLGKSQFTDPALNATLDDFRIYAQALSASDLAALANPAAGAPTRVAASPGDTQATITWLPNATTNYTYTVKRSTTSGGPYTTIATGLTGLTYTDTGLTNGVSYYYVVSAVNGQSSTPDSAEASVNPNTLALRLKFDESSGTVAADSSGRGLNATLVNGPVFAAGIMNNGLSLTATSSQYATLPSGIVSGIGDFTVSTWVKVNAFATWQRIFDFGTGTNNYMFLTTQYTTTAPNAAKLRFGIRTSSVTEQSVSGTGIALTAGTWTHVAVTRSGNTVSLYVNGSLAGSGTITLKPSDLGTTTQNYLGKSQFNDPYLNGSLDEFRLYSRAFSAGEIATLATVLPAPTGLAATAGTGQVALSWNSVSGASGYNVKRATTSGGPYTTIKTDLASTSFTDTTPVNGTTYYYVVSATNLGGESPNSTEASATPLAPPAIPAGLTALAGDGTISLDWTASTGATSYNVKRATTPGGPYTTLASGVTGTSYDDNDLPSGATYYYVVSGVNAVAESANSTEASATTIPAAPTGLTTTPGNGQVTLSWNAAAGASGYTILRATSLNGPYTTLATGVTGTSYADTTTQPGWTYYYAISAGNSSGQSDSSASVTTVASTVALSWLKLDETSGTTAADATGNANTGTLVNSPVWIGGRIGNALSLNGTNQYASLPAGVVSNLHDFTVAAWVYWNGGNNWQRVFDFGRGTSVNMFFTPKNGTNGNPRFAITTSGGAGEQRIDAPSALTTGGWHHIAVTLSGSTGTLYVDGQQVGQNTAMTLRPSDLGATTQNWIGRSQYNDPYLNGRVDDFRIYAGALNASDIAALATPIQTTGLTATGGSGQVTLGWNATTGATSYTVRRATTSGGASTVIASGVTGTSYTDIGLTNGANYYYVVTPANASGDGANSAEATTATIPAAPTGLTATGDVGQIALTWTASTGATGYNVLRATSANGTYTTVATGLTGTSYTDTGLSGGTTYYYVVTATNGSGSSASSTQANAITAPAAPGTVTASGGSTQIALSWTASTGATGYNVLRATNANGSYTTVATGLTGTSYTDTGLSSGTTYYYAVTATNGSGSSANSTQVNAITTPAAPGSVTATASNGQIALSWSASTGATGYNVLRATSANGTYTTVATGLTGTSYTDTGLANGTTYYYAVTATNGSGSSANSTQVNAITAPAAPTGLTATADNAQISLLWNSSAGAATYTVLRSTTSGSGYTTVATGVTGTSYTDTGLTNGTTYYYVVTASNTGGTSANSTEASATPVALPSPWATSDVGSTGAVGSASRSPSGVFTITGAGADIWGSSDAFRYVYQTATGDCDITARVVSVQNTNNAAKGGVMIRESLNANSRQAMTNLTAVNGLEFLRRTSTGGSTGGVAVSGVSAPYWVRLVRSGNTFTSYRSSDGVTWTTVGSVTITMSTNVYIGLLVCSHLNGTLCTTTIDNVTVNP